MSSIIFEGKLVCYSLLLTYHVIIDLCRVSFFDTRIIGTNKYKNIS